MITINKKKKYSADYLFSIVVGIYLVSLPFGALNLGGFGSALKYIGLVVAICWLLFSRKFSISKIIYFELMLIFVFFVSTIYSIDIEATFSRNLTNFFFIILLVSISGINVNSRNSKIMINSAIWASRITAIFVLIFGDIYGDGRISLSNMFLEDPNYLTAYFLFGYVYAYNNIMKPNKIIRKVLSLLEIILYILIILATGSRGGFISYVVVTIVMFVLSDKFKISNMFKSIIFVLLLLIILQLAGNFISNDVLYRFTLKSMIESQGTGRIQLLIDAITIFFKSNVFRIMFGYGTGTMGIIYTNFGYSYAVAHNIFVEILLENGLIGFIMYVFVIFQLIYTSFKFKNRQVFFILIGMIILSLSTSLSTFKPYWNVIFIIVYMEKINKSMTNTITSNVELNYTEIPTLT